MGYPLKTDFQSGKALGPQLTAEWCETVAQILNNIQMTQDAGTVIEKDTAGRAWKIPFGSYGDTFPSGAMVFWGRMAGDTGAPDTVPDGWSLCDGTGTTPDLSGNFICTYDSGDGDYDIGDVGGDADAATHTHGVDIDLSTQPTLQENYACEVAGMSFWAWSSDPTTLKVDGTSDSGGGHDNRPQFYTLAIIRKD